MRDARIIDSSAGPGGVHAPSLLITGHPRRAVRSLWTYSLGGARSRGPHTIPLRLGVYLINLGAQLRESIDAEKNI